MKIEDVLKLKDAGFTNDDIIRFSGAYDEISEQPPAIEQDPAEVPTISTTNTTPPEWSAKIDALTARINELQKTIQASNMRTAQMPETITKSPAEILGDVIAPPVNKKGDKNK